jgi:hypothetical protein
MLVYVKLVEVRELEDSEDSEDYARIVWLAAALYSLRAAFTVTYAVEFMCISVAKLIVLERMSNFAMSKGGSMQKWLICRWIILAAVAIGNSVGLAANTTSAVQFVNAADTFLEAHAFYASNQTDDGDECDSVAQKRVLYALSISSVQSFAEVAVLFIILAAFIVVGSLCLRRVSSALLEVHVASVAATTGRVLWLQMLRTTAVVFVAFLLRCVFSVMYAVAHQFQSNLSCHQEVEDVCDSTCRNMYSHIAFWMAYTPEFQLTVVLISSPLALLLVLWDMTPLFLLRCTRSGHELPLKVLQQPVFS